nr:hypothetical protein [Candidatus Baldrarchaeota archaeon]
TTAALHFGVALLMRRSWAKKPIAWLYSALAALICGLLDLRHFSWRRFPKVCWETGGWTLRPRVAV